MMTNLFKFRDKKEKIGLLLGALCFAPSFALAMRFGLIKRPIIGIIVLIVSQYLWLHSIHLCTQSLEIENRQLKNKLKELEEGEDIE